MLRRHPAGIGMCPSAGAHGTGHVIFDALVSVLQRASTAMQRAVLAFCTCSFSKEAQAFRSFFFYLTVPAFDGVVSVCQSSCFGSPAFVILAFPQTENLSDNLAMRPENIVPKSIGCARAFSSTRQWSMAKVSGEGSTISGHWSVNDECTTASVHPDILAFKRQSHGRWGAVCREDTQRRRQV